MVPSSQTCLFKHDPLFYMLTLKSKKQVGTFKIFQPAYASINTYK